MVPQVVTMTVAVQLMNYLHQGSMRMDVAPLIVTPPAVAVMKVVPVA